MWGVEGVWDVRLRERHISARGGDSVIELNNMSESAASEAEGGREERVGTGRQEVSFHYQMAEMKARKIVTLIKFSKLNYSLEEVSESEAKPFLLRTPQG